MATFTITDITNSRTMGTVEATTERGALIVAKRTIVNPNGYYAATLVPNPEYAQQAHLARVNGLWFNTVVTPGMTYGPVSGDAITAMKNYVEEEI